MSMTYPRKTIFSSDKEDFLKLFLPPLLIVPLIFFPQLQWIAWMGIAFFSVMDISHVYSTAMEAYLDPEERVKRKTLVLTAIGVSIPLLMVVFFAPYVEYIFFYSIIFHNMRQGLGLTLIYYKKSSKRLMSANTLKWIYYFLTLAPIIIYHFKRLYMDFGVLEKYYFVIPLESFFYFSQDTLIKAVELGEITYWVIFVISSIYMFFKVELRVWGTLLFFAGIYSFSYFATKNLLFSTLLLMASHAVPYLFLVQKRTKDFGQSALLRKFSTLVIFVIIGLGACYYFFFFRNVGEIHLLSPLTKFIIILPSYIHYAFDGHVWTKNNQRFMKFLEA